MTETYKAGEHVKIVRSDSGYNSELGDQTGLVGTVTSVSRSNGVYVTFPHTGDAQFYYIQSEIEQAGKAPTPAPEPLKIGDWVKVEGYSTTWDGTVGQITEVRTTGLSIKDTKGQRLAFPINKVVPTEAPAKAVFAEGDRVEFTENYGRSYIGDAGTIRRTEPGETGEGDLLYIDMDKGMTSAAFGRRIKLSTKSKPIPAPKFAVGDWVKVTGYSTTSYNGNTGWEGVKGKVTMVGSYDRVDGYTYIIAPHEGKPYQSGGFEEKHLKATTKPFVPKFKVGAWVEVTGCCDESSCNGTKWQVTEVPTGESVGNYYRLSNGDRNANYRELYLKAATKPWAPKFAVGDWVEITGWDSTFDGEKLQVETVPATSLGYYKFVGKGSGYGFSESYLKATEAPHWTESKPLGATAQLLYGGGAPARVVVKISDTDWLHIYQGDAGKADAIATKDNLTTKQLLGGSRKINWLS